jgi:ketosteroid isomerase-like protein
MGTDKFTRILALCALTRTFVFCALALSIAHVYGQASGDQKPLGISGTWFGDFDITNPDGKVSHDTAVLILQENGTGLTGSAGGTIDRQSPMTAGKVDNGQILFHLDAAGGVDFALHMDAGHIRGTATMHSPNGPMQAEIDVRPAPGLIPHAQLVEEIEEADRNAFAAFEECDEAGFAKFLSKDLEFYHDHTGEQGYEENLKALRDRCAEGIKLRRELVDSSLIVNAVPGYGAIEAGTHRFYSKQQDGTEHLDATAEFTMVWSKESGSWKLTRVISYDHH